MRRPTVLHVVEEWVQPSERFVYDVVRSSSATRPVVLTRHRLSGGVAAGWTGRLHEIDSGSRVPLHAAIAARAVAERASVLHAHFGLSAHRVWRAARRLRRPFVVSLHGWDLLVAARDDPAIVAAARAAELVVVPSRFLADQARRVGIADDVVRVVPSGVELAEWPWRERGTPAGAPVVTFAGRFADKKGVLDVARALGLVSARRVVRARFVGHGPLEADLRRLIAELGLDAEVVDGRSPGAVRAALAATDIAVTASRTSADGDAESLGIVNIEAQACGVPLVTTRHGGVPEAVSPDAAVLVDTDGDVVAGLADAVHALVVDPSRWPAMSRAGRAYVAAHFELGSRTADLEDLWRALARGARGKDLPHPPARRGDPGRASVVVVTHNRCALLDRTLDALSAQTRRPDDVVVVDNGSTDGTAEMLAARLADQRPPGLQVLTRPGNLPVAEGRNLAVGISTGEVVAFTDDDCRPRPTWLETLLAGMRDGVGLVQGRTLGDPAQELLPLSRSQWTSAETGLYETCNVAYTRDALEGASPPATPAASGAPAGPFDLQFARTVADVLAPRWASHPFGEDADLAWRVKRAGVRSRFAVHAVVDHEVCAPDAALLERRALLCEAFPVLVRQVPELRVAFLRHRVFLGPHRGRWWLAAAGVTGAVLCRDPRLLAAAAPYAWHVAGGRHLRRPGGRRLRLAAAPALIRKDAVETVALVRGSWRARTIVL